jgi:hypothetical protein
MKSKEVSPLSKHLHPEHKLPVRAKIMTVTRRQHGQTSNRGANTIIAAKQAQIQREIASKVLAFQQKIKTVQEGIKKAKLRATAVKDINHFKSIPDE